MTGLMIGAVLSACLLAYIVSIARKADREYERRSGLTIKRSQLSVKAIVGNGLAAVVLILFLCVVALVGWVSDWRKAWERDRE